MLISWPAKTAPLGETEIPVPYITNAPKAKKAAAMSIVPKYPILNSIKTAFRSGFCGMFLYLLWLHNEVQTTMSIGAGIQPIKAIKNRRCVLLRKSKDCVPISSCGGRLSAPTTAINVEIVSSKITILIILSKIFALPDMRNRRVATTKMLLISCALISMPNTLASKPAVTNVKAA